MTDTEHAWRHAMCAEVHALAAHEATTGRRLQGSTPTARWIIDHADTYTELVALERRHLGDT